MTGQPREPEYVTATRAGYDAMAAGYVERFRDELGHQPVDRALLTVFAEQVGAGPVLEVGCGPGRITGPLHELGLNVRGIDLSPRMVAIARETHPHLRFDVGSMQELDAADAALAGLVAWYAIIHIAPADLPAVFAEFHRVLAPGGLLLLAFQVGDEPLRLNEAFGLAVNVEFHRLRPESVIEQLEAAGFAVRLRTLREAEATESTPQAYLIARRRVGHFG